jgi:glycosyltransferase involved in cell wall biosynthesis
LLNLLASDRDSVGGAEQVLALLDAALVRAGHRSIVIASEGSRAEGTVVVTSRVWGPLDDQARQFVQDQHRIAIGRALQNWAVDVVHLHGIDFDRYLPSPGVPALVTLHLPPGWYRPEVFRLDRPKTYLHCVSAAQRRACPPGATLLPEIENGVPADLLAVPVHKRNFTLALGRICQEKGFHIAMDASKRAGIPLLLGGEVFPYEEHVRYFQDEILPRLGRPCRFVGPVGLKRKRRLLSAARCLLVPSLAPETSSLVAMEALACGTPVIAFPSGVADIIENGKTGFLVPDEREMAMAIGAAKHLDPEVCRKAARERFPAEKMAGRYLALYRRLVIDNTGP